MVALTSPDELPYETLTGDEPTSTLNGGTGGDDSIILARVVQEVIAGLRDDIQTVADAAAAAALGWVPIASGSETAAFTIDLTAGGTWPAGTFELVRVHFRGATSVDGVRVNARVNADSTAALHLRTWEVRNLNGGAIIDSLAGNSGEVTSWPFAWWSSGLSCNAQMLIFNTDVSSILSMESSSYRASAGDTIRHRGVFHGHLASSRLLSSLQIFATTGSISSCRWWATGYRAA
jgi:hypothetical protein